MTLPTALTMRKLRYGRFCKGKDKSPDEQGQQQQEQLGEQQQHSGGTVGVSSSNPMAAEVAADGRPSRSDLEETLQATDDGSVTTL